MEDAGIVRNRRKIEAAIVNARATVALRDEGGLPRSCGAPPRARPPPRRDVGDAGADGRVQGAREGAEEAGFAFVGPTTMYALMQACGLVNDHLAECWVRDEVRPSRTPR